MVFAIMLPAWLVGCRLKDYIFTHHGHGHVHKILIAVIVIILLFYLRIYLSPVNNASKSLRVHGGSVFSSLVLLGRFATKTNESLKHVNNRPVHTVCDSPLPHDSSQKLFRSRELVIWSADHHPAPACDARNLLQPFGIIFLQYDLSPYCGYFNLCAQRKSLKVSFV